MSKNLTRAGRPARRAVLALPFALAAPRLFAQPRTPLKAAFVYVSPVGEAGWSYQHEQGRLAMQRALGDRVASTRVENVAEGADAERVMRDLAAQGHGLIVATSFGYLEPALRVAAEFPPVKFEHAGGYKTAPNLATYNGRFYEGRFLAGVLAGRTSRRGIAGYVAAFPLPEVVQGINAFTLGMRSVNPKAQVRVVWLNTWFDPAREREAALALINQGADVLTNHSASPAVAQAAEAAFADKGVRVVGYTSDMRAFAPRAQLTAVMHEWGGYYTERARAVLEGRWASGQTWGGFKDGFVALAPFAPDVPKAVVDAVETQRQALVAGRLAPFAGRLVDQQGRVRQSGGAMPDAALATMDWLVEGVVGSLPAAR